MTQIQEPNIPEDLDLLDIAKTIESIKTTSSIKEKIDLINKVRQMISQAEQQLGTLISID